MIGSALLATVTVLLALLLWLMDACRFLIPYRMILWNSYSRVILSYVALLAINLFAAFFLLSRKVFLKDTGRKLNHIEKQLRSGENIAQELSEYLD